MEPCRIPTGRQPRYLKIGQTNVGNDVNTYYKAPAISSLGFCNETENNLKKNLMSNVRPAPLWMLSSPLIPTG